MRTSDFDYELPPELIAQTPAEPRDSSRLLVLRREDGRTEHRRFSDLLEYLRPGDLMVFNQSRVIPARLYGHRDDTGSRVELLLLRRTWPGVWQALARPGRRLRPGVTITIDPPEGGRKSPQPPFTKGGSDSPRRVDGRLDEAEDQINPEPTNTNPPFAKGGLGGFTPAQGNQAPPPATSLQVEILSTDADGTKTVRLSSEDAVDGLGNMPLPPYIHETLADPQRYQTVYAREPGSAAAPTAGLHFTPELMARIKDAGVEQAFVTLHVGLDTFRPVQGEDISEHKIHTEHYEIEADAADALNRAKSEGRRVIAVGTTSVRVLEQAAQDLATSGLDRFSPVQGEAGLFILPGHRFRAVDAMITNFHLPRSTLLMLVSAFCENAAQNHHHAPSNNHPGPSIHHPEPVEGRALVLAAYEEAISRRYRFYSFGDAMLVAG